MAEVTDGPDEVASYTRFGFGPAAEHTRIVGHTAGVPVRGGSDTPDQSAVTIAVAKKKGSNAVWVAHALEATVEGMRGSVIPACVQVRVTRDYGETANEKVNELVDGLLLAIITVIVLIALTMGWREASSSRSPCPSPMP